MVFCSEIDARPSFVAAAFGLDGRRGFANPRTDSSPDPHPHPLPVGEGLSFARVEGCAENADRESAALPDNDIALCEDSANGARMHAPAETRSLRAAVSWGVRLRGEASSAVRQAFVRTGIAYSH